MTIATSYAYTRGIHDIVGGMCQTDYSGYPDCRRVFIDSQQTTLSLALDSRPIELNAIAKRLGCGRLSFGKPELLSEVLGVTPGSVTPFALINDKELV